MPIHEHKGAPKHLFRLIEQDFEALVRMIDRTIRRGEWKQPEIAQLKLARNAAARGADLARHGSNLN